MPVRTSLRALAPGRPRSPRAWPCTSDRAERIVPFQLVTPTYRSPGREMTRPAESWTSVRVKLERHRDVGREQTGPLERPSAGRARWVSRVEQDRRDSFGGVAGT